MVHGTGRNCRCRYLVDDLGRDGNEEAENCGYLSHPAHILTAAQSLVRTASGLVSGHMVPSDVILRRTCPCWGLRPYISLLLTIRVNMIVLQNTKNVYGFYRQRLQLSYRDNPGNSPLLPCIKKVK